MEPQSNATAHRILFLNTLAFMVCFAVWVINGVLVTFLVNNGVFKWSPIEIGWLLGAPVLIGSVFRLPIGMLTDKFGGKWVMASILFFSAIPMFFLSQANTYTSFLLLSLGFGITGASFSAGVAYTSLWYPAKKQGTVLGIFGAGTMGAALTTLFVPSVLNMLTDNGTNLEAWRTLPKLCAALLITQGVIFLLGTQNKKPPESKTISQRLAPLKEIRVWRFGLYYSFVFGGFVALSQWLIPYYVNVYSMSIVTAGFMATAFSLPAGLIRAGGGWLADKVKPRSVLLWVFGICLVCLFFLFIPRMEIQAPGQGIMASKPGIVSSVSDYEIIIADDKYILQTKSGDSSKVSIRFGIHQDEEGFLFLPTTTFHQESIVKTGDKVVKGQLLAKGLTHIYFQANKWIFSGLIFIIGIMMGIGGAAVFKHISNFYPTSIGTVGGIVGVLGGLGGFIGPILFGYLLNATGVWTSSWMFLAALATICIILQRLAKPLTGEDAR
ncbi:MAG: MFS transporter [Pedobacter sp.]|jgi:NNP family nitrate/nitrite transporter-like MFS transporter